MLIVMEGAQQTDIEAGDCALPYATLPGTPGDTATEAGAPAP